MGRVEASRRASGRLGRAPRPDPLAGLPALTSDLWYTLLYLRPPEQRRVDRARPRIWTDPLVRAGLPRRGARELHRDMERWAAAEERRGHAPSLIRQAAWLSRRSGVRLDASAIESQMDGLIERAPYRVAPGASKALERLREGGIRLALVSNLLHQSAGGARGMMHAAGVREFFSVLVFSDEHPWSKPAAAPFRFAARRLGVRPGDAAHIGDLVYDTRGAAAAGLRPILYTGLHRYEPESLAPLARGIGRSVERIASWSEVARRYLAEP